MRHRLSYLGLRRSIFATAVVVGLAFVVAACGGDEENAGSSTEEVVTLEAGCSDPKGFPHCDALDRLAEIVKEKTNGSLIIHNQYQAFGAENELAQEVLGGSVDIGNLSSSNSAAFSKAYLVFDLPFLFDSNDAAFEVLDGPIGKELIGTFEKDTGLKVLLPTSFGVGRDIQTTERKLMRPEDIRGLKVRTTETPVDLITFKAWGANPSPIDWGQTYTALQQGVVDGENAALTALVAAKHTDVLGYNLRLDYQLTFNQLFINGDRFASLSEEHQKALTDAAEEVKPWQREHERQRVDKVIKELGESGVEVIEPTAEQRAEWASVRDDVWAKAARELDIDLEVARRVAGGS